MFKKLTDFSYKRNWKEAIGFYLAYLLVGLLLGGFAGGLSSTISGATNYSEGFNSGLKVGQTVGAVYPLIISILVLTQRKLYNRFGLVILALLSGIMSIFGGAFLGLIIPSFITTRARTS